MGHIEQHPSQCRILLQRRGHYRARAATDVGQGPDPVITISCEDCFGLAAMKGIHGGVKDCGVFRFAWKILKDRFAECKLVGAFTRSHVLCHVRVCGRHAAQHASPRAHGTGNAGTKQFGHWRRTPGAVSIQMENAQAGQETQYAMQLCGIRVCRSGQLRRRLRLARKKIGDAQLGGHGDGLRHYTAGQHLHHLERKVRIHESQSSISSRQPRYIGFILKNVTFTRSQQLMERARLSIPGGVNSPVRAYRSVGGTPPFSVRGEAAHIFDADGNEFIDYIGSWGPLLIGHRHPEILAALEEALGRGTSFGAPTVQEIKMAETIREMVPSMELVRLVNSGTEATMSALRVARGFTGRDLTIKFEGCYHGHVDSLLVKAGSGVATLGLPDSPGVPKGFSDTTITLPFNSVPALEQAFSERGPQIAAVIVEPVCGNMGCIPPGTGFLEAIRDLTTKHGALLIFDEVMTGFRVAPGGAQQLYNIKPDLTTLGKVIGGGLPIAAYGGRRDVMERVAPSGPIYQAGTLSGNPLAVAAGLAMLRHIQKHPEIYDRLNHVASQLAACAPQNVTVNRVGSMLTWFFTSAAVTDYESAKTSDTAKFGRFFHGMLQRGIYLPPSQFEAMFVSVAHTDEDIARTVDAARASFSAA